MNKMIFVLLIAALMSNIGYAQKISVDKVPAAVTSAFKTKFPTVTKATWEMEGKTEYEVNFLLGGVKASANFDNTGKWLETETELNISALPAAIQSTLKKDFAGFKINEATKIESVKHGNCYEAEIEKGEETFDILFTVDGKILSKTKLEEEEN